MLRKLKVFDVLAIISAVGVIAWIATDFFGGMIIHLLMYGLIIIPILILYIISFVDTIAAAVSVGIKARIIRVAAHTLVIVAILLFNLHHSDILKSKRILTATLRDDQMHYTMVFRENGKCENQISGMFGFEEIIKGKYTMNGDTIIFQQKPYDNDFIPDTLIIDRSKQAIFIQKDKNGNFVREKEWLNHFEINKLATTTE